MPDVGSRGLTARKTGLEALCLGTVLLNRGRGRNASVLHSGLETDYTTSTVRDV
jgi:hypothetical protein